MTDTIISAFAPGRVNLIGEHTDYNAGFALPFAIEQGVTVTVTPTDDGRIEVFADDLGERDQFALAEISPATGWRAYVRGAVSTVNAASSGSTLNGAQISFSGDLPHGAGLSSSAAVTLALLLALGQAAHVPRPDDIELARQCQAIEHHWAGAQTGLLDPLASLTGQAGQASLIDFEDLTVSQVPLDLKGHSLVVLDSGEPHDHSSSGYNERREECTEAAYRMRLETLRSATITDLHMLPDELVGRARHVISEIGRVLTARDAIVAGDYNKLGMLLTQSHASLRNDFEVSTVALDAAAARLLDAGALGARMIGGGFGGSVLGLMPPGSSVPDGARTVIPAGGARLLA